MTTNACPVGTELGLLCLWICEIIPIERFEKQIPRIVKLIEEHRGTRFFPMMRSAKDTKATLRAFKDTVLTRSWYNFHTLDCASFADKLQVDYMSLEMSVFSGGHIGMFVRIVPNMAFSQKLNAIVRSECPPYSVVAPPRSFRAIMRGWWGSRTLPGETKKRDDLQQLIIALKESVREHLQGYFSGLLFKPGYLLPALELWSKIGNSAAAKSDPEKPPFVTFWDSVGFPQNSTERYVDASGQYTLQLPELDVADYTIKVLCDEPKVTPESGFGGSMGEQISHHVSHWVPTLLGIWSLRSVFRDFIDELSANRLVLFSRINRLRAGRTFRWAKLLSVRESEAKRLEEDMDLRHYSREFAFSVPVFTRTVLSRGSALSSDLIANVSYLIKKYGNMLKSTQRLITVRTEAHVISTNRFTQLTNLGVSIIILVLSVLMVATGVLTINSKPKLCDAPRFAPACRWVDGFLAK